MMTVSPGVLADQTEYASCLGDRTGSTTNFSYNYWYYGTFYSYNLPLPGNNNLNCTPTQGLIVNPGSPPTQPTETPTCTTNILPEDGAGTYYALYRSTNDATGEYCLYSLESDGTNWVSAQLVLRRRDTDLLRSKHPALRAPWSYWTVNGSTLVWA